MQTGWRIKPPNSSWQQ